MLCLVFSAHIEKTNSLAFWILSGGAFFSSLLRSPCTDVTCPTCGETGHLRDDGSYGCKCGIGHRFSAVLAKPEICERLEKIGFQYFGLRGDHYTLLVDPPHALWFYADESWYSDKPEKGETLDEYLNRVSAVMSAR